MKNNSRAASLICVLMILCIFGSAQAQSGRRAKAITPAPVQQPAEAEPALKPTPATKPEARRVSLFVTFDEEGGGVFIGNFHLVLRGFIERLKKNSAINHKIENRMDRKEASDLAKSQTEAYVVWLQLDRQMTSSRMENNEIFVEYAVFPPGAGKSKTEGRVYVRGSRQRIGIGNVPIGVPLPLPPTGSARLDNALLDAGRETAERVMPELDVMPVASSQ